MAKPMNAGTKQTWAPLSSIASQANAVHFLGNILKNNGLFERIFNFNKT